MSKVKYGLNDTHFHETHNHLSINPPYWVLSKSVNKCGKQGRNSFPLLDKPCLSLNRFSRNSTTFRKEFMYRISQKSYERLVAYSWSHGGKEMVSIYWAFFLTFTFSLYAYLCFCILLTNEVSLQRVKRVNYERTQN